jgi:hypothetical protein
VTIATSVKGLSLKPIPGPTPEGFEDWKPELREKCPGNGVSSTHNSEMMSDWILGKKDLKTEISALRDRKSQTRQIVPWSTFEL